MHIDLAKLNFTFTSPPLLIGGMAMQYYGLRPSGADIDFVIARGLHPPPRITGQPQGPVGDLGVCVRFEIWQSICLFDYDHSSMARSTMKRIVSSRWKSCSSSRRSPIGKYHADLELIVKKITDDKYAPGGRLSDAQRAKYVPEPESNEAKRQTDEGCARGWTAAWRGGL
jgi:hypothetical protein